MMKQKTVAMSIFKAHVRRIGFMRAIIGGGLMYTTIPLFIFLHITVTVIFYRVMIKPLFGFSQIRIRNYIIIDRYNLKELNLFDRFNCLFCEYANGVIMLLNAEIEQIAIASLKKKNILITILVSLYIVVQTTFFIVGMLITTMPTNILMNLLGLHRGSHKHVIRQLHKEKYAYQHTILVRRIIYVYKIAADVIAYNLEQIESAWCPIKHLQKVGCIFPTHHKNFYTRDNLSLLYQQLETDGTVSDNLPKF